jgi:hypothetical protein
MAAKPSEAIVFFAQPVISRTSGYFRPRWDLCMTKACPMRPRRSSGPTERGGPLT